MKNSIRFLLLTLVFLSSTQTNAAMSPIGLSFLTPVQLPNESFTVAGARLNVLWGTHTNVYGFDIGGLGNVTTHEMTGLQVAGLMNWNKGTSAPIGIQVAGLANSNVNKTNLIGVQAAVALNYNQAESSAFGIVVAAVNLTEHTKISGLEVGLYNISREVYGFQVGLINKTQNLHGLQIGLLNFNTQGLFAVSPILNVGF